MHARIVRAVAASSLSLCALVAGRAEAARPAVEVDDAAGRVLAEVRVTARRREEKLQSVPAAISVLEGDLLDRSYTVNTQQLSLLVPALYYNSANPRNTAYTIRGLGSNTLSISAANDGMEPGVGFYVDQVYHGRPATASFDFTDIDRVEVLRGPQGTLFGKNTTAGAIQVTSRAPTFESEASGELSVGGLDHLQAKATVSGPLAGKVAGRLSAQLNASRWRDPQRHDRPATERPRQLRRARPAVVRADRPTAAAPDRRRLGSRFPGASQNFLRVGQEPAQRGAPVPGTGGGPGLRPAQPGRLRAADRHRRRPAHRHAGRRRLADCGLEARVGNPDLGDGLALLGLGRRQRS